MLRNKNEKFSEEMIGKILKDAIGIQTGEIVLLQFWGEDEDRGILHAFSNQVAALGASPVEFQHARSTYSELFRNVKEGCFLDSYYKLFDVVDIVIDLCMYKPVIPAADFPRESMDMYRKYMGKLFQTLVSKKKLVQLRVPTKENALEAGLTYEVYENMMWKAYDINYVELKKKCQEFLKGIGSAKDIRISTGENKQLTMFIEGRNWEIDAGDGDLPCGEVSIAPIEDKTNGEIFFETLYYEDIKTREKKCLKNIIISVKNGKMEVSSSNEFNDYLNSLPPGGNVVCEFGLGMNEGIHELTGYELLDEKMIGTFHIAIGNNTMFGGTNSAPLHQDFVGTGIIYIGDKQISN